MATISTNRATMPNINPNIRVGRQKRPYLSTVEQENIRKAIRALSVAVNARDHNSAMVNLSSAFQTCRKIILDYK